MSVHVLHRVLVVSAVAVAGLAAGAAPASAACYGDPAVAVVCATVEPQDTLYERCVDPGGWCSRHELFPVVCASASGDGWAFGGVCQTW